MKQLLSSLILFSAVAMAQPAGISYYPNSADTITAGQKNRFAVDLYRTGMIAEYRFDSATAITDYSGNGNTGTVVGSPTISGGGISGFSISNYVSVPVTGAKTISFLADFGPTVTASVGNYAPIYGSSSTSSLHLFSRDGASGSNQNSRQTIWSGGSTTKSADSVYGVHVVTYVISATNDLIYIDGVAAINYPSQRASSGTAQSGMQIGAATGYGLFFPGAIYYMAAWSAELSQSQVLQSTQAIVALKAAAGVQVPSAISTATGNVIHAYGDSLTFGQNTTGGGVSTGGYTTRMTLTDTFTISNYGYSGQGAFQGQASIPGLLYPQFRPLAQRNIAVLWMGTNDISGSASAASVAAANIAAARQLIRQGFQVFVVAMISRTGFDTPMLALNVILSASATSSGYTFVPLATLAAAGLSTNSTHYLTDGIHLKDDPTNGYGYVGAQIATAINAAH
jgi:hypothetical protein